MHIDKDPEFFNFNDEYFKHYGMGDKVAQASISKLFRSPVTGDWIIKVVCNQAKGFFTVENNEYLLKSNMPTKFVNGIVFDNKKQAHWQGQSLEVKMVMEEQLLMRKVNLLFHFAMMQRHAVSRR